MTLYICLDRNHSFESRPVLHSGSAFHFNGGTFISKKTWQVINLDGITDLSLYAKQGDVSYSEFITQADRVALRNSFLEITKHPPALLGPVKKNKQKPVFRLSQLSKIDGHPVKAWFTQYHMRDHSTVEWSLLTAKSGHNILMIGIIVQDRAEHDRSFTHKLAQRLLEEAESGWHWKKA